MTSRPPAWISRRKDVVEDGPGTERSRQFDPATWAQIGGAIGAPLLGALAVVLVLQHVTSARFGVAVLTGLSVGAPAGAFVGLLLAWLARIRLRATATRGSQLDEVLDQLRPLIVSERLGGLLAPTRETAGHFDVSLRVVVREPGDFAGWRLAERTSVRLQALPNHFIRHGKRLVLLGAPGSGKSLAALRILEHVNTTEAEGVRRVAEVFNLATWVEWRSENVRRHDLVDWMAASLRLQWGLNESDTRALVRRDLLVPVFDGLDELDDDEVRRCAAALNSYFRAHAQAPFVVCCREEEYRQLAPDWITPEDQRELVIQPLSLDQVAKSIRALPVSDAWQRLADTLVSPMEPAQRESYRIFTNPLYLTVALRAARDTDPDELAGPDLDRARRLLWDRYVATTVGPSPPHTPDDAIRWLSYIARGLLATLDGSPVLWLHWLHWFDQDHRFLKRFRRVSGVIGAVLGATVGLVLLVDGVVATAINGSVWFTGHQIVFGALIGWFTGSALVQPQPSRAQLAGVLRPRLPSLLGVAACGLACVVALVAGAPLLLVTLSGTGTTLLVYAFISVVGPLDAQGRNSIASRGPYGALRNSAVVGLTAGLLAFTVLLLVQSARRYLTGEEGLALNWTLLIMIMCLGITLFCGVDAVLWHFILRRHLARQRNLPLRLVDFLRWAAAPDRGWVGEVGGSFRFRHREFQEYLVSRYGP